MIIDDIIIWVKKLPYWQQYLSEKILMGHGVSESDLDHIYNIFKKEFQLVDEVLKKEEILFAVSRTSTIVDPIKWRGLRNVFGVNALKSSEKLEVGDNLTLIYGENGSGKSGYTRLLNNIFISRGDKIILSNIFSEEKEEVNVDVLFEKLDNKIDEYSFPEIKKHPYASRVSVFDTHSATHDLTTESELNILPTEFVFFEKLLKYTQEVKKRLDKEISDKTIKNSFIDYFDKDTVIKDIILDLDFNTKIDDLIKKVEINESDTEKYKNMENQKIELKALKIEEKSKEYSKLILDITNIKRKIILLNEKFSSNRLVQTKELLEKNKRFTELSSKEGLVQFKDDDITELGSQEWKDFIEAAQNYYTIINENIDYCIFCGQKLDDIKIIDKYWNYLQSSAEKKLKESNNNIAKIKEDFKSLSFDLFIKESKIDEWLQEYHKGIYDEIIAIEKIYNELNQEILNSFKKSTWNDDISAKAIDVIKLDELIELIKKQQQSLDSDKIKEKIHEINVYQNEYSDKQKVATLGLVPQINLFILNSLWVENAKKHLITTVRITKFQTKLFSKYVTNQYIKKFDEECEKLNANFSAEIKQRGRIGTTMSKLTVKGNKPTEVLSEGEQRSIALANFLAETSLHNENICIIFDDPVSSLDYSRREIIAQRLVEEAREKQVVIFTHDLTFLLSLQSRSEKESIECRSTKISKIQNTTGIVENDLPWIGMLVKKRIGYLKEKLKRLERLEKEITPENPEKKEQYEELAKFWTMKLRETWERTIEEILFNNAVQRFSPSIQTQKLKNAPFTNKLYKEIEKGMSECSNWIHDRASGLGEYVPDSKELNSYLFECESFIKNNRPH